MGVIGSSVMSLGIATVVACLALLIAVEAGCAAKAEQSAEVSTASVALTPPAVRLPARPRPYAVPAGARVVSSSRELVAALADGRRESIVLAPGTYDNPRPFADREGDRLFAERLGRAVFRAGVVLGANAGPPGASIRGLTFDVSDPAKTLDGAIVHVWGSAAHASVLDTRLHGDGRVETGLLVRQARGFVGRRIVASGFLSYGVAVDPNDVGYRTRAPFSLADLAISQVRRSVPGSSNGRAEACLWLGSPGTARRISARRCGITGIWTGTAMHGSRVSDATIDRAPVGIYIEHFTTGTIFERLRIGPSVARGVNAEWSNLALGQKPASSDNVIKDGYFRTTHVGVYLDQGTTRTLVRRCIFVGQAWAAIGDYLGDDNRYYENDFAGIGGGAVAVSHAHDPAGAKKGP
jgi:hypothetical protein